MSQSPRYYCFVVGEEDNGNNGIVEVASTSAQEENNKFFQPPQPQQELNKSKPEMYSWSSSSKNNNENNNCDPTMEASRHTPVKFTSSPTSTTRNYDDSHEESTKSARNETPPPKISSPASSSIQSENCYYPSSSIKKRVGVVYSHRKAFAHLPQDKGTKSFYISSPICVEEFTNQAAFELQVQSHEIRIGYWGDDGHSPVFFTSDRQLQMYLMEQPKVVPFVQVFAVDPENRERSLGRDELSSIQRERLLVSSTENRPKSQNEPEIPKTSSSRNSPLEEQQEHDNFFKEDDGNDAEHHQHQQEIGMTLAPSATASPPTAGLLTKPPSMKIPVVHQTQNQRGETIRVVKDPNGERGLQVLPPTTESAAGSLHNPWRLNLDSTTSPSPIPPSETHHNNPHHHSSSYPYQPMYSRPVRRLPSITLNLSSSDRNAPMPNEFINLDSTLNEDAVDYVFDRLKETEEQEIAVAAAEGEDTTKKKVILLEGVRPICLLDFLDITFENLGDRRRFEKIIGPRLMIKEFLNRNEVAIVILKVLKE